MMKIKKRAALVAAVALTVTMGVALDARLLVRQYTLTSEKLTATVRLALITDLHSCKYGKDQRTLLAALEKQSPDLVLMAGDIIDDEMPFAPADTFLQAVSQSFSCYYTTGNHEIWTAREQAIKAYLQALGVTVLSGVCAVTEVHGQVLNLCGVDDPTQNEDRFAAQLDKVQLDLEPSAYTILLTHRPERVAQYVDRGFDLVTAGHAHGGQWRLPLLLNGLLAPNQGLFPAYAGGRYTLADKTELLVSRGLARESTPVPRIFNRPELVIIDIKPQD